MTSDNEALARQKQYQKSGYQSSRSAKQRQYDDNTGKLNRLYRVKHTIEIQKGYANERYKSIKSYVEGSSYPTNWVGNKANETKRNIENDIVNAYRKYIVSIDEYLDAVCDEITRLENVNAQLNWDILHLGSLINSLANEIEKLFN